MKKLSLIFLMALAILVLPDSSAYSSEDLELSKDFTLFTSKNLQGYSQPLFTSIEESMNSNIFTTARYKKQWTIGLDLSFMGMFIPDDEKFYEAERPDLYGRSSIVRTAEYRDGQYKYDFTDNNPQPTIYGGHSTAIYAAPQNHAYPDSLYKSVAFVEGNNISFMSGLPIIQLFVGLPTQSQVRFRFFSIGVQGEPLTYFGFMLNHQLDQYFNVFEDEDMMGFALNFGFHSLSRTKGISLTSWSAGAHFSKGWDNGVAAYAGLQFEGMSGTFEAKRKYDPNDLDDFVKSPFSDLRDPSKPIKFDIESENSFRLLAGFSYRYSFFELHADAAWAKQPVLSAGVSFFFAEFGGEGPKVEERREKIEKIDRK